MNNLVTIELTDEEVNDILDAALYSGISYWASDLEKVKDSKEPKHIEYLSEALTNGWALKLKDTEEDMTYKLTKQKFLSGIGQAVREGYAKLDDIDAPAADCIVQCALFGKVMYS